MIKLSQLLKLFQIEYKLKNKTGYAFNEFREDVEEIIPVEDDMKVYLQDDGLDTAKSAVNEDDAMTYKHPVFNCWDIVGMNHYNHVGFRNLYCAMKKGDKVIKHEGRDVPGFWATLRMKAIQADL